MQFELSIPIRPHLKKMIALNNDVNPFKIKQRCHYGQIIFGNLERNYIDAKPPTSKEFTDKITVLIAPELSKQNRVHFGSKTVASIHQALNSLFYDKLFTFLDATAQGKGDIRSNVDRFFEIYGINEDDLKRETVIKKYYRHRKSNHENDNRNFRKNAIHQTIDKH